MNGPNPEMENNPIYIQNTINMGYDVEIDAWLMPDGIYLGHDNPIYKIDRFFLQNKKIWVHCKNIEAFINLNKIKNINCFFQENDDLVMTSQGYLWAHSKCDLFDNNTVVTKLDAKEWKLDNIPYAICSDYLIENNYDHIKKIFDLLIIDIDGVMTDGTKVYDRDGKIISKSYCDLDFTAIKRFKSAGINVCFLSGDKIVNEQMALSRKIDFFHNVPGTDKIDYLCNIKRKYNSKITAYVGDDYYDTTIMNVVDFAFCPNTSPFFVKQCANIVNIPAGKGVIAGIYDIYERDISYSFPIDSKDVNPK